MRAAQTTLRRPALLLPRRAERPRRECAGTAHSGAVWLFGTMFLAGYLPGIWLGRGGVSALGQQLAAYYTKSPENAAFAAIFGTEFSVSFLQLTAVFLCGFCVLGVGLLALLFAARGVFLGYCAASVAAVNGAAGLVQYRLATIGSDAATLFFCLWLAGWSARLAGELLNVICGRATRETPGTLRRLAVRFGAALVLSAVFSAIWTFLAFVTAKIGR
ncbi:hypothetical protein GPK89_05660 [Gemmiger formicilis]|uniref:hypothetical protein n=1 Tax=Gemmiger formicilis TaxID=745368 RepID=UPI001C029B41|nr:hypothetical protein [Gemmiger formicilis]MBT9674215.1 hypothetical protein [Gemmiger formicilis]